MEQRRSYRTILCIIYGNMILYGFIQTMRGVLYPLMKNAYNAPYTVQGLMVSMVSFVSVIACAVAGIVFGARGFRKTIGLGFALIATGMAAFRFAPDFWIAAGFIVLIQGGLGFFEISLNVMGVKTFTRKPALMMSLLHFCFGVGATLGPRFGGFIAAKPRLGWQNMYLYALPLVFAAALLTLIFSPGKEMKAGGVQGVNGVSEESGLKPARNREGFRWAISNPAVWLFGICMGLTATVEGGAMNWSGLYLQDVFGLDPKTAGASFVSLFYFLYAVSRLAGGFIIEKTGYFRGVMFAVVVTLCLLSAGFLLGLRGVRLLPVTGLFIGVVYPTLLAMSIGAFKEKAQAAGSVMLVISFSLSGAVQYLIGLTNRYIGEAWGFRSSVLYGVLLICALIGLQLCLRKKAEEPGA